jgi:phage I-like protein
MTTKTVSVDVKIKVSSHFDPKSASRNAVELRAQLATPPTEFRLFAAGTIRTTKGDYLFDDAAAESVMAAYADMGHRIVIDYEHQSVNPDARAGDGKAAGWCDLEVRNKELWAVNVKWTPPAATALANFEWAYMSPTFEFSDDDDNRILELINVAITNVPATKKLTPLVAASRKHPTMTTKKKALDAKAAAAKLAAKTKAAKTKAAAGLDDADDASLAADPQKGTPMSKLDDDSLDDDSLADDDMLADGDDPDALADDDLDDDPDAAAMDDGDSLDDGDVDGLDALPKPTPVKPAPPGMNKKMKNTAREVLDAVKRATGKSNVREAMGAIQALGEQRAAVEKMGRELALLKRERLAGRVSLMIKTARKEGKVSPAEVETLSKLGMRDPRMLKGLLDVRVQQVPTREQSATPNATRTSTDGKVVTLHRDEADACARMGTTDQYVAAKAAGTLIDFTGAGTR